MQMGTEKKMCYQDSSSACKRRGERESEWPAEAAAAAASARHFSLSVNFDDRNFSLLVCLAWPSSFLSFPPFPRFTVALIDRSWRDEKSAGLAGWLASTASIKRRHCPISLSLTFPSSPSDDQLCKSSTKKRKGNKQQQQQQHHHHHHQEHIVL